MPTPFDDRKRLRLLEQLATDRDGAGIKAVDHYQALFPGHDEAVAGEWRSWAEPVASDDVRFGQYRLERALGRGGQGIVYQAVDTRLGRRVALKILNTPALGEPQAGPPRLLAREVEALTRLDDPRIAGVFEAGVEDGRAFLAMRLVNGPSLRELLTQWQREAGPSIVERLRLGLEIVRAVASAHGHGVLHRDIKPSNVLLERAAVAGHRPVLIDFGLARAVDGDASAVHGETMTGDQIGTPSYMSPERLLGEGHDDPRADVWALGVLLYELVTYRAPFTGKTFETVARRIERDEMPRLDLAGYGRRRDLEALLACALEKPRGRRYADAKAMADDLELLLDGKPIAARPVGQLGRGMRWVRRHPAYAAILVLLLSIATLSSWVAWQLNHSEARERDARQRATASLGRSEADRGHLLLESEIVGRYQAAREHLERAAATDIAANTTLRSDYARTLVGIDLVARPTIAIGGLGVVKVDPTGAIAAAHCISPESRELELSLHALGGDRHSAMLAPDIESGSDLLATHRAALAFAERKALRIVSIATEGAVGAQSSVEVPARRIAARFPPGSTGPGVKPHDFAAFAASGQYVVAAEGKTWTLYGTGDGAALATGTADSALAELANFSPDGRWFVVRQDERTVFFLDRARKPIKLSFDHEVVQAMPANGEHATLLVMQAKPAGIELGAWYPPNPPEHSKTRYQRLAQVAGASFPTPRLAVRWPWIAAATTEQLVVVDATNGQVAAHCALELGQGIESLVWRGDGADLIDLELFVQQRAWPLRRFGFARPMDCMQCVAKDSSPFVGKRRRLLLDTVASANSRTVAGLPEARIGFGDDDALQVAVSGALFLPAGSQTPSTIVDVGDKTLAAALVHVVRQQAIECYAHVWQRGQTAPTYWFDVGKRRGTGAVAISDDGNLLAVVRTDGRLQLHDLPGKQLLLDMPIEITDLGRAVRELAFRDGCLWLRTSAAVWRFELNALRKELTRLGLGF